MRNLGAIVGILLGVVGNTWQDRSTGRSIALQFVGDDPEWLLALTAQQSAEEPLGCMRIGDETAAEYPSHRRPNPRHAKDTVAGR